METNLHSIFILIRECFKNRYKVKNCLRGARAQDVSKWLPWKAFGWTGSIHWKHFIFSSFNVMTQVLSSKNKKNSDLYEKITFKRLRQDFFFFWTKAFKMPLHFQCNFYNPTRGATHLECILKITLIYFIFVIYPLNWKQTSIGWLCYCCVQEVTYGRIKKRAHIDIQAVKSCTDSTNSTDGGISYSRAAIHSVVVFTDGQQDTVKGTAVVRWRSLLRNVNTKAAERASDAVIHGSHLERTITAQSGGLNDWEGRECLCELATFLTLVKNMQTVILM